MKRAFAIPVLSIFISAPGIEASGQATGQKVNGFFIRDNAENKKVDVLYNGQILTSYCYFDSSFKTMLYPINTVNGITVTRAYPLARLAGERTDHPHHAGSWFNYESVNGLDFWNNSVAIAPAKRSHYGTIVHDKIVKMQFQQSAASLVASAFWMDPAHHRLLREKTTFYFTVAGNDLVIDRITKLTADTTVVFADVKDGLFAIRVARELELPSTEKANYVDRDGNITNKIPETVVTGMYKSSEGLQGDSVWGTQARWVMLTGKKDDQPITIAIFDHPANVGYPAYWHARGYGLFGVNPLGRKVFSHGKEALNLTLAAGESVTFRYRLLIHAGAPLTSQDMETIFDRFKLVK